ncbi:hypothetical protein [Metabacillus halosaccharovorans]|uniref:hypothetical protein n=1 Tax=Metabacillus halosaccharovorans TaxID=930124 RepID=UPI000C80DCDA|nr:hypothetical protein [Metabacillus halosaccharovorans]MCM3443967.1 hypothetical protein [Metabacillus halosaccharovorans]PMC34980.1 hypothetical protein CJ195_20960 [Bacillus sp. UMB0899]
MDKEEKKDFARLKRRTSKLINKCDEKGVEFTDIEVSAISRVGHAESIKDLSWLVIDQIERIFDKYKIR